jgi:hypothetical protein
MKWYSFIFFLLYVALSWWLPEFHPFSRYPMYSSFPNYAYSFYVSDSAGQLIPYKKYFKTRASEVSHQYCEVFDSHKWVRVMGLETDSQLRAGGAELLRNIILTKTTELPRGTIQLHRLYYRFENDSIHCHATQLAEDQVE